MAVAEFIMTSQTITNATAISKMVGTLDANNFTVLEDEFNKLLTSGIIGLVLDISAVETVTSASLGAFINMSQLLTERKGKLVVAAPKPNIMEEFAMLRLTEILTIVETAEQGKKMVVGLSR